MFDKLLPDWYLPSSLALSPAFFLQRGIRAIISDIDNTLVTYDDPEPTEALSRWLKDLADAGIKVLFVSNNSHRRVEVFNASLGYYATAKSRKPSRRAIQAAIDASGCDKSEICMLGDQIFTDVYAAKRCGIRAILVPPIRDKRDPFTRFKRLCERPMLRAYRKRKAKEAPKKFAVLGDPIAHSRSPLLHATLAKFCDVSLTYEAICTTQAELPERLTQLRAQGYYGFNCTMPLKTDMFSQCTMKSEASRRLESVNTVSIYENGFFGTTTDGIGLIRALKHHGVDVGGKKAVLLGAGGAARSVADALIAHGASVTVLNRTEKMCGDLMAQKMTQESLASALQDCDLLIQATSLGMAGQSDFEDLSFVDILPPHAVVLDLVYHPLQTSLLQAAQGRGLLTVSGLWMLLYQGIEAFTVWCGVIPSREVTEKTYQVLLQSFEEKAGE